MQRSVLLRGDGKYGRNTLAVARETAPGRDDRPCRPARGRRLETGAQWGSDQPTRNVWS